MLVVVSGDFVGKHPVRRTTSIKVRDGLWREVKHRCVDDRVDISDHLEWLIARDLAFCAEHPVRLIRRCSSGTMSCVGTDEALGLPDPPGWPLQR